MGKRICRCLGRFFIIGLLLLASGITALAGEDAGSGGRKVKIGVIAPFTGPDSPKGESGLKGIKAFLKTSPLLRRGDEIELVVGDDGNNPAYTVTVFQTLVEREKVTAVLVLSTSGPVLEINRSADQYETPVLALIASHPEIAENRQYISQLCFDNRFQGKVAALFIRDELFLSRVAVFEDAGSTYSLSLSTVFREKFPELDGSITDLIPVSISDRDLEVKLKELKAQDTECLYLPLDAKDFLRVSRVLREIDWAPLRMGGDGLFTSVAADFEEELYLLEGSLGIDVYSLDTRWAAFGSRLLKQRLAPGDEEWNTYAMAGAEGMAVMVNALDHSEDPRDREEVNRRLRETVDFEGFMGNISLDASGKVQRPLIIHSVKNGRPEFLVRVH